MCGGALVHFCEPVYLCTWVLGKLRNSVLLRYLQMNTEDVGDGSNQGVDDRVDGPWDVVQQTDAEQEDKKKKKKKKSKRSTSSSSRRSRTRRRRPSRSRSPPPDRSKIVEQLGLH